MPALPTTPFGICAARTRDQLRSSFTFRRAVLCVSALVLLSSGCASNDYLTLRRVPRDPLTASLGLVNYSGLAVSERTSTIVRRFIPSDDKKDNYDQMLDRLEKEIDQSPTPETVYAVAEISYVAGKKAEAEGKASNAFDYFARSVAHSYYYLFAPNFERRRNVYDPEFRQACDLYNSSLEGSLRIANKRGLLKPGKSQVVVTGTSQFHVNIVLKGNWKAEDIERFEFVNDYELQGGLTLRNHTYGLGVPVIAVRRRSDNKVNPQEAYFPERLSFPATAFLRVNSFDRVPKVGGIHSCSLELHDPLVSNEVLIHSRLAPLETDITTPLAYLLDTKEFQESSSVSLGFLKPGDVANKARLYMLEPFDPKRIPVVMVHGLFSSPTTWMEMFNDLRSYPEIRERYQFWFFRYPTGQPFWKSAADLRETLVKVRDDLDPRRECAPFDQMVLVGHSMGGLVAHMQTISSGDQFWKILSERPFAELKASEATKASLEREFFFEPNPSIKQVVTLGTPFSGSAYAQGPAQTLSRQVVRLPDMMLNLQNQVARDNPGYFRNYKTLACGTSIDSLSPDAPIFPVLRGAARAPWVNYRNVVGVAYDESSWGNPIGRGDGYVSVASAHLDNADEVTVRADHLTVHRHPKSVLFVRRYLEQHSGEIAIHEIERLPAPVRQASAETEFAPQ